MPESRRIDPVERAHLRDAAGYSPPIYRFAPTPALADVVRRFWLPVWSLPNGVRTQQRVLQYPVCLVAVADTYANLVGPTRGLATRELVGAGWACGTMLQSAAGSMLLAGPVRDVTDGAVPLESLPGLQGSALIAQVRRALGHDPHDAARQQQTLAAVERALAGLLPVPCSG